MRKKDLAYWGLEVLFARSASCVAGLESSGRAQIAAAVAFSLFAAILFTLLTASSFRHPSRPEASSEKADRQGR